MINWYGAGRDVDHQIAKGRYSKAVRMLREMLADDPADGHLRRKLADVLALDGRRDEATSILEGIVDQYADDGFITKAIAVVKKIQRIDPKREDLNEKLAGLAHRRDELDESSNLELVVPDQAEEPSQSDSQGDMEALLRSPLFTDFSISDLLAFIQGLNLLTFQPGEIVISEGEPGTSLLVLATGQVRVYVRNDFGHQVQLRTLEPGEFFGEISILTGLARTATVTAAAPCEILELDQKTLETIGEEHPRVSSVIRDVCLKRAKSPEEILARTELEIPL